MTPLDPNNPAHRRAVRELIGKLEADSVVEDMNRATGWIVLCLDCEFGTLRVYGTFADSAAAMVAAHLFEGELNMDDTGPGYTCMVYPILPNDDLLRLPTARPEQS